MIDEFFKEIIHIYCYSAIFCTIIVLLLSEYIFEGIPFWNVLIIIGISLIMVFIILVLLYWFMIGLNKKKKIKKRYDYLSRISKRIK